MRSSELYKMGGNRPKGSTTRTKEEIIKVFADKGLTVDPNQVISNDRKIAAFTKEGYKIEGRVYRIEQGIMPHIFGADTPYTIYNLKEVWLPKNAPDYELLDDVYVNGKHKMTWRLKNSHLPDFQMNWNQFQKLKRHPTIGRLMGSSNKKRSTKDVLEIVEIRLKEEKFHGWNLIVEDDYEYIDEEDILFFRNESGYLACQNVRALILGYGLQRFHNLYPDISTFNMYLWDKLENERERLKEGQSYTGSTIKYYFVCEIHGVFTKWFSDAINGVRCKKCESFSRRGESHPKWDATLTEEERDDKRRKTEYRDWVKAVYKKDEYKCKCCLSIKEIVAHHKDGFNWCVKRRTDITNGVVLCRECHAIGEFAFHRMYGSGNNTEDQYEEWLRIYQPKILQKKSEGVLI